MSGQQIRDIPKIQKQIKDMEGMRALGKVMPFLRPILKLFKVDVSKMDEGLSQVDELEKMLAELVSIPDRFNDLFAPVGWIIYDRMNFTVAKAAIKMAEKESVSAAEAILVDYYSADEVQRQLRMMHSVQSFRPRMALAEKALIDYREERYHACVPVVLAQLDGMVNDLHRPKHGFFSQDVNLEAWDSVAAHSKGLAALTQVFQKGRYKTTDEVITIPYRNGILHGADLGYDNKIVAAKTWAALFATCDWAILAERGELGPKPEEPKPSWREITGQIMENERNKKLLEEWQPRVLAIGEDVPATGSPEVFEENTPERKLAEFLDLWQKRNYGNMAKCVSSMMWDSVSKFAGRMKEHYQGKKLVAFEFVEISDNSAAITVIKTKLVLEVNGQPIEKVAHFRMFYGDEKGDPRVRDDGSGSWAVMNWSEG